MTKEHFAQRVLACERRLYRVAYAILHTQADCEDAVQEAILRAWRGIGGLREPRYFETWLVRILINKCRRLLADRGMRSAPMPEVRALPPSPDPSLDRALRSLDAKYRIPIALYYLEGYGVREIAEILRIPGGTASWRLSRGRALLRAELEKEENP